MAQDRYEIRATSNFFEYQFTSDGPKGPIEKVVQLKRMPTSLKVFNLAFGDVNKVTGRLDDFKVSNNSDTLKVLATVAYIVELFTDAHPDAFVYATGSTKSRNRLYQMSIKKYWHEISKMFDVYGEVKDRIFIEFISGINFSGFAVTRKKSNFIM